MAQHAATEQTVEKCLTFRLGDEVYGIGILKVQEIIGMLDVTSIPRSPDHLRGVINLRGRIIPVVDLRRRFGLEAAEDTDITCVIVVQVSAATGPVTIGVIVDEVREVVGISADQIEDVPDLGAGVDASFISGVGKLDQQVVLLLDIDNVLKSDAVNGSPESAEIA